MSLSAHPQEHCSWRNALLLPPLWSADATPLWLRNCPPRHIHTQPWLPTNLRAELPEETSSLPRDKRGGRKRKEGGGLSSSPVLNSPPKGLQAQAFGPGVQERTLVRQRGLYAQAPRQGAEILYTPGLLDPKMAAIMKVNRTNCLDHLN